MIILGIETSCDDTCASLVEIKRGQIRVLSNVISSQAKIHSPHGGVFPELAAREHIKNIIPVINEAITTPSPSSKRRGKLKSTPALATRFAIAPARRGRGQGVVLNAIAVTVGPGLITSLLVGVETAKALAFGWNKPIIGVNHIEGHIYSPLLPPSPARGEGSPPAGEAGVRWEIKFPAIALIVSGGHTELILMKNHGQYKLLGRTRDDAAGECFDKSAKMLGLGYPGGPLISKLAATGNPQAFNLPRPMIDTDNFEFSFSGLKNAVRLLIEKLAKQTPPLPPPQRGGEPESTPALERRRQGVVMDLAASIEQAIIDILVHKSLSAVKKYQPKTFILAGGVSANKKLRATLKSALPKSINFLLPDQSYTQDNAAMIALAGYQQIKNKAFSNPFKITANANWELV